MRYSRLLIPTLKEAPAEAQVVSHVLLILAATVFACLTLVMVWYIRQLRKTKRIGLAKLVSVSDVDLNDINTFIVASKIAPRLNSLGRIDDPQKGVEVLLIRFLK